MRRVYKAWGHTTSWGMWRTCRCGRTSSWCQSATRKQCIWWVSTRSRTWGRSSCKKKCGAWLFTTTTWFPVEKARPPSLQLWSGTCATRSCQWKSAKRTKIFSHAPKTISSSTSATAATSSNGSTLSLLTLSSPTTLLITIEWPVSASATTWSVALPRTLRSGLKMAFN